MCEKIAQNQAKYLIFLLKQARSSNLQIITESGTANRVSDAYQCQYHN